MRYLDSSVMLVCFDTALVLALAGLKGIGYWVSRRNPFECIMVLRSHGTAIPGIRPPKIEECR